MDENQRTSIKISPNLHHFPWKCLEMSTFVNEYTTLHVLQQDIGYIIIETIFLFYTLYVSFHFHWWMLCRHFWGANFNGFALIDFILVMRLISWYRRRLNYYIICIWLQDIFRITRSSFKYFLKPTVKRYEAFMKNMYKNPAHSTLPVH